MAAKGVNDFTGKIDVNYWKKQVKNAKNQAAAVDVISKLMGVTTNGIGGVSDGDQRDVISVIKYYETLYDEADLSAVYNTWDPSKNHINAAELKNAINTWTSNANNKSQYFSNGYQPNNVRGSKLTASGKTVGSTTLKGSKNLAGSSMDSQKIWKDTNNNLYVWVGMDGNKTNNPLDGNDLYGYYQKVGENGALYDNAFAVNYAADGGLDKFKASPWYTSEGNVFTELFNKAVAQTQSQNNTSTKKTTTTTVNNYNDSAAAKQQADEIAKLNQTVADYKAQIEELLKPMTAEEAAKHLNIDYNKDNILRDYNEATNQYYDEALAIQNNVRNQYIQNAMSTADQLANDYIDSYKYMAGTATNKGALAANLLSTQLNNAYDVAQGDVAYSQSLRALEKGRQAELANNPYLAEDAYNKLGTALSSWGATKNYSDVKQYVDTLDAYSQAYAANRQSQAAAAANVATKYSGLANAAATNSASSQNSLSTLYKLYQTAWGNTPSGNKNAANSLYYDLTGGVK